MKKYLLTVFAAAAYGAFTVWAVSGGVRGNELIFSLLAVYAVPVLVMLWGGIAVFRSRINLIPIAAALCWQILAPLLIFKRIILWEQIIPAAALAAGLIAGFMIKRSRGGLKNGR